MNISGIVGAVTTALAVVSAAFGVWKQKRELFQKIERDRQEEMERHAKSQNHQYGLERDINHLKNDVEQLKRNLLHLHDEGDRRLDDAERKISEVSGALSILRDMVRGRDA